MHMYWNCPGVVHFWKMTTTNLSDLLNTRVPYCPKLLLLNDTSCLNLSPHQLFTLLVGLMVAKKMSASRWQPHAGSLLTLSPEISGFKLYQMQHIWRYQWRKCMMPNNQLSMPGPQLNIWAQNFKNVLNRPTPHDPPSIPAAETNPPTYLRL